ncbi:MAG: menaquinone biosynthesis protein [Candidatus Eremiobacteraeota bacterium]|nr:menaquinone biosynthesis protein [Candidatus Eremiobacteraeota bacterium]
MPQTLRCGRITYTNDLPLYAAFDEGAIRFKGDFVEEVPARLNQRLLGGDLDLSPMSAAIYARHADELVLLDDLCVGSRDWTWSVLLVSPTPPQLLDGCDVEVMRASATGRALLQVLLERRYNVRAGFSTTDEALQTARMRQPTLLIGDEALDARAAFQPHQVYDLGHLWHEWTGADMVFAVWVARRETYAERKKEIDTAMNALRAARTWGETRLDLVARLAQRRRARPAGFYQQYYRTLNYYLDLSARAGLAQFISELDAVGLLPGVLRPPEVRRAAS